MSEKPVATVIGDVVGSRTVPDRAVLHARLTDALADVNDTLRPTAPLRITVGDEYQGVFDDVGKALTATLRLRLALHPEVDVRHGVGWGPITVLSEVPRVEDGPGWWAAREAIVAVEGAGRSLGRALRTAYRRAEEVAEGPEPDAINAALLCQDTLLASASTRSWGVLRGLLGGMSQTEIARAEQISVSAVGQRIRKDGLAALVAADELLGGLR